jgi:predicted O-methyltransferase YrrM
MKHFYKNIIDENWFDYKVFYTDIVKQSPRDAHFVEVGSWKGKSSCFMAVEIANSGKNIKFDCVDTWDATTDEADYWVKFKDENDIDLYQVFLNNIEPVKTYINPIRSLSWEAASMYKDASLDFIFIDAAHDYESVTKDLVSWFPKLKLGGIIAGHDYFNKRVEVQKAVDEYFENTKHELAFSVDKIWYVKYI